MSRRGRLRVSAAVLSFGVVIYNTKVIIYHFTPKKMRNDMHLYENPYWVSPIPSTGCSKVRSPDSFTKQNVFDFTYPTNIFLG